MRIPCETLERLPSRVAAWMSYVLIDATEGAILGHTGSLEDLVRIVQQASKEQPEREVRFGRPDEHSGQLVSAPD